MNNFEQLMPKTELTLKLVKNEIQASVKELYLFPYFLEANSNLLTKKEKEVSRLILESKRFKEIGKVLYISDKTVSKHASNIYKKLKCRNKREFISEYSNKTLKQ